MGYEPKNQQDEQYQDGIKPGLSWEQVGPKIGLGWDEVEKLFIALQGPKTMTELKELYQWSNTTKVRTKYVSPLIEVLLCATDGLVGMEIPADAEPEDAAAIFAIVDEGIDGIVRRNIPSASIEHIGDESRKSQSFLHQFAALHLSTLLLTCGYILEYH